MLDLRIESFLTVCKHSSYTRAAEELCITQPAVTQHIKALEKQYGCSLIQYQNRELRLTKAGEIFYKYAKDLKASETLIIEKIKEVNQEKKTLKFASTLTIGEFTIAPYLSELFQTFPEYHFSILVDNTNILMEKLRKGEIHFALIEGLIDKDNYDTKLLKTCDFILVTAENHEITKKKKVILEDLLDEKLIIREKGSGSREILERGLAERNRSLESFREIIEMGNVNVMKRMTMEGVGISLMYRDAALEELKQGRLVEVPVENLKMEREFNFVQIRSETIPAPYQQFLDYFMGKMK